MFANIVPDTNLPSVDSSFTSAAASASFSASNSNNSRSHSADSASASSFRTHVTVPDVPAEATEGPNVDWICDTDSDEGHSRSSTSRRAERRRRSQRNAPGSPPRHPRSARDPGTAAERRDALLAQLRRAGVDAEALRLLGSDARSPQDQATLLRRLAAARPVMDHELFRAALALASDSGPAPRPRPRSPGPPPPAPIAFGYVARPAEPTRRRALRSSSEDDDDDDDDDDLATRPAFGPAELAHIEAMLAALPGRRPPPDEWWAGVGLRRTALRYAREGGSGSGSRNGGRSDAGPLPPPHRADEPAVDRRGDGEPALPPTDGPREPAERVRTLREELERMNEFVEGQGGPQRESHL